MDNVLAAELANEAPPSAERRRPGRVSYENNALIELLRDPAAPRGIPLVEALPAWEDDDEDPLRAAKGVAAAVFRSLAGWTVIGVILWMLF